MLQFNEMYGIFQTVIALLLLNPAIPTILRRWGGEGGQWLQIIGELMRCVIYFRQTIGLLRYQLVKPREINTTSVARGYQTHTSPTYSGNKISLPTRMIKFPLPTQIKCFIK